MKRKREEESGRERPLEARKISKHDSVSNSLFTSLDLGKGEKVGGVGLRLYTREKLS